MSDRRNLPDLSAGELHRKLEVPSKFRLGAGKNDAMLRMMRTYVLVTSYNPG